MQRLISLLTMFLFLGYAGFSQNGMALPLNIRKAYQKQSRDLTGVPGKNYWQNKATYRIDVKLQPDSSKITGSEEILYKNNSPDTLNELVITVLADFLRRGNPNDFGIPLAALNDGMQFSGVAVNGEEIDLTGPKWLRSGTNAIIRLDNPLLPGQTITLAMAWNFIYPKGLTIRCGDYGDSTFFVAYFYPKVAVYDDLDGWDRHNYTGYAEFFGEQSDYTINITVPGPFKVWATGELQNPEQVFSPEFAKKWQEAQRSMTSYTLIGPDNYLDEGITASRDWNTWTFRANHVPDVAFGTSDKFLWDIINVLVDPATGRKATLNAAYRVDSKDYYRMTELGKKVLTDYSTRIPGIPYPYPEMTIFNGNSGMEFPMMCNNVSCEPWHETAGLAYHEIAHTYVPFFVGTNERKYAWMDEGWANLMPLFYFKEHSPDYDYMKSRVERYLETAGSEIEVPIMTLGDLLTTRPPYRQASYNKPYFAYYFLYEMLGEELFTQTLRSYMQAWAGKHPMPYDFFNAFAHFSGTELNWFWKNWFFERNYADLTLVGLENDQLIIRNTGGLFVPIKLRFRYLDGTEGKKELGLDVWKQGDHQIRIPVDRSFNIESITLESSHIPDADPADNVLILKSSY